MSDEISQHDRRERRCPRLGHEVPFSYCRAPGSAEPCRKILDCWWEIFEVEAFVRTHYGDEAIARIAQPLPNKVLSLVELIERARKAAAENQD